MSKYFFVSAISAMLVQRELACTNLAGSAENGLLQACKNDFDILMRSEHYTVITPGLEFWNLDILEKVWKRHKDWNIIRDSIKEGYFYPSSESPSESS